MLLDKIKSWYRSVKAFFKRQVKKVLVLTAGTAMAAGGGAIADDAQNPYIDRGDFRELPVASEVRDSGEQRVRIAKNRPEATFEKWNGEAAMRVSVPSVQGQGSRSMFSDKLTYGTGDRQVEMRQVENGYKVDIILNSQPKENEFVLDIENAENLDFFYQPELTEVEIEEGAHRPENVVGSYAVYHKTKANHIEGQTNYATGKAYHIYRPKVIDDEGNETWGEMEYKDGKLSVTVPQSFLDKAVYPVVVDPTFGYESGGSSEFTIAQNTDDESLRRGVTYELIENGILDSLTVNLVMNSNNDTIDVSALINTENEGSGSHDNVATIERTDLSLTTTPDWYTFTANGESIIADMYILNVVGDGADVANTADSARLTYDSTGTRNYYAESLDAGYTTLRDEDPWTDTAQSFDFKFSIYATYSLLLEVDTQAATNITLNSGDGNGETFNATTTERGFVYDLASHATPTPPTTDLGTTTDSFESVSDGSTDLSSTNIWKQASISTDDGDWQGETGATGSSNTGADDGQDGTVFIYTEGSSGQSCDGTGSALSCIIEADITDSANGNIDFWYHLDGADIGTLALDAYDGSTWTELWSVSGDQGTSWLNATAEWSSTDGYTHLRFDHTNAGTGFEADASLDNIAIHEESVGENSPANSDYSDVENETGTFPAGTFSLTLSGLSSDTTYYVRAYASSTSNGYVYGDEVNFTTNAAGGATPQSEYFFQ